MITIELQPEIWAADGGEYVDGGHLGCDALWSCKWLPAFTLKMEALRSSETLVTDYKTTASQSKIPLSTTNYNFFLPSLQTEHVLTLLSHPQDHLLIIS
jgi:hypothetical protein